MIIPIKFIIYYYLNILVQNRDKLLLILFSYYFNCNSELQTIRLCSKQKIDNVAISILPLRLNEYYWTYIIFISTTKKYKRDKSF